MYFGSVVLYTYVDFVNNWSQHLFIHVCKGVSKCKHRYRYGMNDKIEWVSVYSYMYTKYTLRYVNNNKNAQ